MEPLSERRALALLPRLLAEIGLPVEMERLEGRGLGVDAILRAGKLTLALEWKGSGAAAAVAAAIEQLRRYTATHRRAIPLVAVPFMGQVGQRLCEQAQVSWLDLSGNAHIVAPGVTIHIEGRPNQFKSRGRPSSVFAPMSARVVRWLLIHFDQAFAIRELARATSMDAGFTSRIVARLVESQLVARDDSGAVRVRDPNLLLESWHEAYDFTAHRVIAGHVAARTSEALVRGVAENLTRLDIDHAATGLSAAWLLTQFAGFRVATFFVREPLEDAALRELGLREDPRGANLWLVVPNDKGVFDGAELQHDIRCAHPVQVYLDLKGHPERAPEAAADLRQQLLKWGRHA